MASPLPPGNSASTYVQAQGEALLRECTRLAFKVTTRSEPRMSTARSEGGCGGRCSLSRMTGASSLNPCDHNLDIPGQTSGVSCMQCGCYSCARQGPWKRRVNVRRSYSIVSPCQVLMPLYTLICSHEGADIPDTTEQRDVETRRATPQLQHVSPPIRRPKVRFVISSRSQILYSVLL
ncbi:hypothetical protein PHLGIDRAFT_291752 [Phlebiopsis gigantea 11061_1 CR5-6]|uniref:Uncharacterized protein n=1 Tax=Phlebiopsis gigantea (strain 11061_1 CR5-6) TaxID=745531 RepID=A0A0C3RR77_PHLG1|nr:hypothetical protein PHLGIDRAFT_291752 [Phlebiopsis gigantea 11061_1 CR5-6]